MDKLDSSVSDDDKIKIIKKSLVGRANRIIQRVKAPITLDKIIHKLDTRFADSKKSFQIMKTFYSAEQGENEFVSSWASRLEDIIDQAVIAGEVDEISVDKMLREQYWVGLREDLQDVTHHKYDSIIGFDKLEEAIRTVEQQRLGKANRNQPRQVSNSPATAKAAVAPREELDELKTMFKDVLSEVASLRLEVQGLRGDRATPQGKSTRRCFQCGDPDHIRPDCPQRKKSESFKQTRDGDGQGRQAKLDSGTQKSN